MTFPARSLVVTGAALAWLAPAAAWAQCNPGWYQCGSSHCTPSGAVCCASVGHEEGYCNAGDVCTTDGRCVTPSSGGSGGGTCGANETLTQASCGGDTCSCAAGCVSGSDCTSGCCSGGFCANACVCRGSGTVNYACGGASSYGPPSGSGYDPPSDAPRWGCSAVAPTLPLTWLALALLASRSGGRRRSW